MRFVQSGKQAAKYILGFILLLGCVAPSLAVDSSSLPDRRKDQFPNSFGYALFPYPYSLPGLGSGLSLVGGAMNINNNYLDAYGLVFSGDVKGGAIGVGDIHIIPKTLILEVGASDINKAAFTNYSSRGMDSDENDYTIAEIANTSAVGGRLIATYFDRRLEFFYAYYNFDSELDSILDRHGDTIIEAQNSSSGKNETHILGITLDLTDDYSDPRKGSRFELSRWSNPGEQGSSEFSVWDLSISAYIPLGARSTWAFNYFQSDAHVNRKGETNRADVEARMGLDCASIGDANLQRLCDDNIDNQIANNIHGTAGALGGFNRLRAYPEGRYEGAHIRFAGTEIRWNLTDEFTPIDLVVFKDIRTSIQVAFFFEIGSVADQKSDLDSIYRTAYGTGLRMVTASGVVFRADLALGDEGAQPNIFIGYPWEL